MVTRRFLQILVLAVFVFTSSAMAERSLPKQEIVELFETLTSTPVKTWISSGQITARHTE